MNDRRAYLAQMIGLISSSDLAEEWGYAGPNDAFRAFLAKLGIRHVPGRPGWFDPHHVRQRLDSAQGIVGALTKAEPSLVELRRARNAGA